MNGKNAAQLGLFILITALFWAIFWSDVTKTALGFGIIGGLLVHYGLTNKGNKAIVNIKPLSGGFRVLLYDVMILTVLATLYEAAGDFSAFLNALTTLTEKTAVLGLMIVGLVVDYFAAG